MTTPDAVVVGGRTVATGDHGDLYLTPGEVATRLGAPREYVSRWPAMRRYAAGGPLPCPANVAGQHVVVGGRVPVLWLASATDAWASAVAEADDPASTWATRWAERIADGGAA